MFTIIHTYTGEVYGSPLTVELSGFSTRDRAIDAAEARCLDLGGSYVVVLRDPA